ncbi:MAG TPA: response regulator transcription factor [Vicinamibacterales bacterium]
MKSRILVVEDDPRTSAAVALYLRHAGYDVDVVSSGPDALERAAAVRPDLLVLDVMLPGVDGIEVCRALRARTDVAIIMLTARAIEDDRLRGLEAGADDYVTKPFSPRELVARVGAVLRRAKPVRRTVRIADVEINLELREVRRGGRAVAVTATEFRLLEALLSVPGRAFTREELAERAFGHDHEALDRTIDAHIMNLRRKLERDRTNPDVIVTVFGTGYRLGVPDAE